MSRGIVYYSLVMFFICITIGFSYGQQCTINANKTDITAYGANNGTATVTISGGQISSPFCSSPQFPMFCFQGCVSPTFSITANNSTQAITVNSGQLACIQGSGYKGVIQLNAGGNVYLCGNNAAPSNIIFNGGVLSIGGSSTISSVTVWNATGSTLLNYGALTFNTGFTTRVTLQNEGTITVNQGDLVVDYTTGQLFNDKIINIISGNFVNHHNATNTGTLTISGSFTNDYTTTFANYCTMNVGGSFTNNSKFTNNGTVSVVGNTLNNNSSTMTLVQRTIFSTNGFTNNGSGVLAGTPNSQATNCGLLKASGNILMAYNCSVTGAIAICQSGGTLTNQQNIPASFFTCACNPALGNCSIVWTNSSNIQVGTGISLANLPEDIYTVTVNCSNCPNSPINASVTIKQPLPPSNYAELSKELDGHYQYVVNKQLYFKYVEKYSDADKLFYQIYDYHRNKILTNPTVLATKTGTNFYQLDLTSIAGIDFSKEENTYFTLEVLNAKGERFQLRFKYSGI